jgi:hypothetical protein
VVAAANLSLNVGNMKEMEQCVIVLVLLAENRYSYQIYHNFELLCKSGFDFLVIPVNGHGTGN